jgi:protein gp37
MTKIEWTKKTWNPITGCTKISPGCANCYAEKMALRLQAMKNPKYRNGFEVTIHTDRLEEPLKWKKPCSVFVCSMGDLFHHDVSDEMRFKVLKTIVNTPQHTYQILTKRIGVAHSIFTHCRVPNNLWLGVTAENQAMADKRIPVLLEIPAKVRFVSIEPMLEEIRIDGFRPGQLIGEIGRASCRERVFQPV